MNKVSHKAIKQLLELEDSAALSIYLPTHRFPTSEHIQEDKIRFKNLVRIGKEKLEASGADEVAIGRITDELENTVYDDDDFWQHTTEGLAVFAAPAGVRFFHLPIECEEYVSAGDSFDIAPLLAIISYDCSYYLLALAMHEPALFKGDMYGVEKVAIDMPESPEVALNIDELFSNSQTVRGGDSGSGNPGAKSHGQGDSRQAGQEEKLKFFRIIDEKILSSKDIDTNAPFLISGVDDDVSGYKESSRIKHVLEVDLNGNHTETPPHELHALSWPLVAKATWHKAVLESKEKFGNLLGTGRSSTDADMVMAAANEGRVDMVLAAALKETRDSISDSDDVVMKLAFSDNYERGKISALIRNVFNQGGKIQAALHDMMPENTEVAAVYRY